MLEHVSQGYKMKSRTSGRPLSDVRNKKKSEPVFMEGTEVKKEEEEEEEAEAVVDVVTKQKNLW